MFIRYVTALLLAFGLGALEPAHAAGDAEDQSLWSSLKSGGHVILIRHASTEPGIGDPPNFRLGDCSTQRNLSAKGREDARRIGEAFRSRAIPILEVLSSRWCRCLDTAQLAFGKVRPAPMIDSTFNDGDDMRQRKARELFESLAERSLASGNLVLVTHAQNIQELTGVSPASGEMVLVKPDGTRKFRLVGRIDLPKT
jgi:phosphohistidine phosphatase SixA